MARKSIEDVMNEIEDFLNSCKPAALSSNKIIVPRDEFEELFGDLKVKIPAEIDRCKKIMRNKEAILMDARKSADGIIAQASEQARVMVSETEIVAQANQTAYETVEMARVQANEMLAQAVAEANEIRLGSMQYTNDIMMGIRNYVEITMEAERANYENLIETLNNDYMIANANLEEIQNQIVEFTGNPDSVTRPPKVKNPSLQETQAPKAKTSMVDKVKQAVGVKSDKTEKEEDKNRQPAVNIPDFIASGENTVPNETPLKSNVSVKKEAGVKEDMASVKRQNTAVPAKKVNREQVKSQPAQPAADGKSVIPAFPSKNEPASGSVSKGVNEPSQSTKNISSDNEGTTTRKVKKKIVKKRNPVIHTPQTAHETVAKTLEAAAAAKVDKTVYKANGEQERVVPPMEGRVTRGPRVGRGMVEEPAADAKKEANAASGNAKPIGVVDDYDIKEF